jgi:hypothetical protein
VAGTGSGAFISGSGDILTADHVVQPPDEEILYFAAYDIASVLDNLGQYDPGCGVLGGVVSPSDVANGLIQLKYSAHVTGRHSFVWLSTAYSGLINASTLKDAPTLDATVEASSSYTDDDVAIIHVGLSDTPSIPIGRSDDVAVEDHLTVIGFPGNGDVTDNPNNMLTPSVNSVTVSAIKRNDNGSPLIQVAGNVEHGDSGGPLLDAQGQVVGVVSFAGPDPQGSTTFMRATSSAQPLFDSKQIITTPGHFEAAWTQAFDAYAATYPGHWHDAAAKMEALAAAYPQFKALDPYLNYAQTAAAQEQVTSNVPSTTTLLIAGGAAIAVVLLAALTPILVLRARAKRKARQKAAQAAVYANAYAGVAPQPYGPLPGQPLPPFPNSPYSPVASAWPGASQQWGGQPSGPAPLGAYSAGAQQEPSWGQPSAWEASASGGSTSGAPAYPPGWSRGVPEPSHGTDVYNTNGGVGPGGTSGH